jgi:hypothetical protein
MKSSPDMKGSILIARQSLHISIYCLVFISLGGCASGRNLMRMEQSGMNMPIKTLVMESPMSIEPKRLQAVFVPDTKQESAASAVLVTEGEKHAQEYALASMKDALGKQTKLEVIEPPAVASPTYDKISDGKFSNPITRDEADWLKTTTGADAILRFGITDYGLTPKSWRNGYITFEVTSTLAIAGVIAYAGNAAAKAAAGAYLVQEGVEETAESYAGFWALDVVSRPVRIEAELVRLNPVETIWKYNDTGLSDVSLSRLTRKVDSIERNSQLDQSTHYAVRDVVAELSGALKLSERRVGR